MYRVSASGSTLSISISIAIVCICRGSRTGPRQTIAQHTQLTCTSSWQCKQVSAVCVTSAAVLTCCQCAGTAGISIFMVLADHASGRMSVFYTQEYPSRAIPAINPARILHGRSRDQKKRGAARDSWHDIMHDRGGSEWELGGAVGVRSATKPHDLLWTCWWCCMYWNWSSKESDAHTSHILDTATKKLLCISAASRPVLFLPGIRSQAFFFPFISCSPMFRFLSFRNEIERWGTETKWLFNSWWGEPTCTNRFLHSSSSWPRCNVSPTFCFYITFVYSAQCFSVVLACWSLLSPAALIWCTGNFVTPSESLLRLYWSIPHDSRIAIHALLFTLRFDPSSSGNWTK